MPLPGYPPNQDNNIVERSSHGIPNSPSDFNPVRSLDDIALVGSQILNQGNVAEGSTSPPQQDGTYRVPSPSSFKVVSHGHMLTNDTFVLSWQDVDVSRTDVAVYRIYAQNAYNANQQPTLVGTSAKSPVSVSVQVTQITTLTFFLQPVLVSGITLPLAACPTTTYSLPDPPFFEFTAVDPLSGHTAKVLINDNLNSGGASNVVGMAVIDTVNGHQITIAPTFLAVLNGSNVPEASIADNSGKGVVRVFDGSGSGGYGSGQRVILDGNNGVVKSYQQVNIGATGSEVELLATTDPGPRVASGTYWHIKIAGTDYYVPLFT